MRKKSIQICFFFCQCQSKLIDSVSPSTRKKRFLQLICHNFLYIRTVAYSLKARIVEPQQTAVTRQRPVHNNRRMVFSAQSVPIGCARNNRISHTIAKHQFHSKRVKMLLWEARIWGRGQFGNPEVGECPPLKTATMQRLVNTATDWEVVICPIVICEVCRTVKA
jgi:hypothetical protein